MNAVRKRAPKSALNTPPQPADESQIGKQLQTCLAAIQAQSEHIERMMADFQRLLESNANIALALSAGRIPTVPAMTPFHNGARTQPNGIAEDFYYEPAILNALASAAFSGSPIVPRQWVAVLSGYSAKSGMLHSCIAKLLKKGQLLKAGVGAVTMADPYCQGMDIPKLTLQEIREKIKLVFQRQDAEILLHLTDSSKLTLSWCERKDLADVAKMSPDSSVFRQRLSRLKTQGFIEFGPNQTARITLQWFRSSEATA